MQTDNLTDFDQTSGGVVLFNEDGSFDYVNKIGAEYLWGYEADQGLFQELIEVVQFVVSCGRQQPVIATLGTSSHGDEIRCAVSIVSGHVLVVLGSNARSRSTGVNQRLDPVSDKLYLLNSVYVDGSPVMVH